MTHPNNPYLLKAQLAAKALEEKLEVERQAELTEMSKSSYCNPEPYTETELRAIGNDVSLIPDSEDTLEYIRQWEIECRQVTEENKMSAINKQVKHRIQNAPYYLWDNLIVKVIPYADHFLDNIFEIYRIELVMEHKTHYLDIITNASQRYLGLGGSSNEISFSFDTSKSVCESLAVQKYMEEAN